MNSKLRKKIGAGVIVLLVTACFIPAIAGAFAPGDGWQGRGIDRNGQHRPVLGIWRDPQMIQKLGLTAEQVKQLKNADFTFREKRLTLKAQIDSLRLQMDRAFSEDVVDDTVVLSLAKKISDLQGKLIVQNIETRLTVEKLLNADQVKKLKLHDMHQKKRGPGHGEKQMSRRHSIDKSAFPEGSRNSE